MTRTKARAPSSSPAPIRESQPQPNSPTTTAHGTQPHHALYDTPPKGTQQPEFERSERPRTLSARGRDAAEYQHRTKPAGTKSSSTATQPNAAATQSHATTATQPASSQRPKKRRKRRALRFDGESSGNESNDEPEGPKPRKTRNTGPKADSPPPRPPGRGGAMGRGIQASEKCVVLEPAAARALGDLVGINISSATPTALKETLRTLSDPNPPQMGPARRYPQVQSQSSAPLPSLNKKGVYYHERLLELAHPHPSESQTHTGSGEDPRFAKHPHGETRGESADEEMLDPDADEPDPDPAALPPLPSFLQPSQDPHSTSSTQRAVVNAFASQREPPHPARVLNFHPTPVAQPNDRFARSAPDPRPSGSEPRPSSPAPWPSSPAPRPSSSALRPWPPTPEPRPSSPEPRPSSPEPWPSSPKPRPKPALSSRSAAPSASTRKPPPNPNTATKEETESEPQLKPKPKRRHRRSKKKSPARDESPESDAEPPEHRQQRPGGQRNVRGTSPVQRRDMYTVLQRLSAMLDDGVDPDNDEIDSLLQWTNNLMQQCHSAQNSSSHTGSGPSSSRAHAGSASSRAHAGSSTSHTQPGPPSNHHDCQRLARDGDPSGYNTEQEAGTDEDDDVEDTDADDPVVAEKLGLGRYPGTRGKVASRAIPLLLFTATQRGVYQHNDTYIKWARNVYRRAWKAFCPHISYRECPLDLLQTIITRISNLRTEIKKRIRQVIRFLFKFALGLSEEAMSTNRQLVARLGHNTFHCRRLETNQEQYEHPIFVQAICEAYFWYPDTFFIRDSERIDTLEKEGLALPAVAFVLTMMQECIEEWQTGRFRPRDLNIVTQCSIFDAHLHCLLVYRRKAAKRLAKFQVKWFEAGLEYAGIEIHRQNGEDHFCQLVTQAENVRPDTPTDSEPEYDDDGRLTTRSKGKNKARGWGFG